MLRHGLLALCAYTSAGLLSTAALADHYFTVHDGSTTLRLNGDLLAQHGLTVRSASVDSSNDTATEIALQPFPSEEPMRILNNGLVGEGAISHYWGLILTSKTGSFYADQVVAPADMNLDADAAIQLVPSWVRFDPSRAELTIEADVLLGAAAAAALGDESLTGAHLGTTSTWVNLAQANGIAGEMQASDALASADSSGGGVVDRGGCTPNTGPDVIVGDMQAISNYSTVGGIDAFSVGTVSCNIGSINMNWIASSTDHPVIPQNMYRLKTVNGSGRFEQIGQSWMKHAFTALTDNLCCTCNGAGGSVLGVGCSDPYTSGRNGTQMTTVGGLGPRFQVNAHTGGFIWPYAFRNTAHVTHTAITRRLQVAATDLDAALNAGASYFIETQYVTPHDARYANQDNNCSYRPCTISGGNSATVSGTTQRMKPAIQAWKAADAAVTETWVATPEATGAAPANDTTGTVIVSSKATQINATTWHYEYAVFNMNSDRSISSFSVPVANAANVTNIEFHDVPYHSGDGFNSAVGAVVTYDGTDWPGVKTSGAVVWNYVPASPLGNSNVLRWGTMYNFRFDADLPPVSGNATLGLFKDVVSQPNSVTGAAQIPGTPPPPPCPTDFNHDGETNLSDLSILLAHYGLTAGAGPDDGDVNGDGDVDLSDLSALLAQFGTTCPT